MRRLLESAIDGRGTCLLLRGDAGVGKSRLLAALRREAETRKVLVAAGSAFGMETGIPYGAVAELLGPTLRAMDPSALTVLARGAEADLRTMIPGLGDPRTQTALAERGDAGSKAQLFWNVSQFLARLATRQPLLLMLDNAHDSDASSLEFLHFLVRQLHGTRIMLIVTFADGGLASNPLLERMVRSLLTAKEATVHHVEPLSRPDLAELLQTTFALPADDAEHHAATLWSHTRGNAFFVEESLKALTTAGRIRRAGAQWLVDDTTTAELPHSVRTAVQARLDDLSADARRLAESAAILENRASLALLERLSGLESSTFADAIDLCCSRRILIETRDGGEAYYEFAHPIIQSTVRGQLTAARERALHASAAQALESLQPESLREPLGAPSNAFAAAIARHLLLGNVRGNDVRTLRYLATAGRDALTRRADAEAARWLTEALAIAERIEQPDDVATLLEELATAQLRTGNAEAAASGWTRALTLAAHRADHATRTRLLMLLVQEAARRGDIALGLRRLDDAARAATDDGRPALLVRVLLARAKLLQALGRHDHATHAMRDALHAAEPLGDLALLGRVHQTALQLYAWTGPAHLAREHGARALDLATQSGDREVAWAAHWAMAMLEGFTGSGEGVSRHTREAAALADALASPELQAMTAEIMIEHASGIGRWDEALQLSERMIPLARAVMPGSLLPRLLVWTGLIVLSRDDTQRARALFEEAWQLTGAERAIETTSATPLDVGNVHNVILAHTGMGTYHLSHDDWARAVDYGERGLILADRFGYTAWAIHRLIPMILEARLRLGDYDRAEALAARLRTQSAALGHRLGLAWATAAEALLARVKDQRPDAATRLLAAAAELDTVPFVFHAARMRRNAAQVLAADGDVAGAVRELRVAHDVFVRLGAGFELRGTRSQLRALGVRLPPRTAAEGFGALTGRELEVARAVARRLSNKEIGAALDISARTVSTHLSNIFEKLGVDSRGALADHVREQLPPDGEA